MSRLDYYTGLTFKVYLDGAGARVGSGGRYDGLTASFGKTEPAVGFVLDLDALTDVLGSSARTGSLTIASPLVEDDESALFRKALAQIRSRAEADGRGRRQQA